jgi:hypothetical protein
MNNNSENLASLSIQKMQGISWSHKVGHLNISGKFLLFNDF